MVSRDCHVSLWSEDTICALKASYLRRDGWRVTTSGIWRLDWRNGKIPKSKDIVSMTVAFPRSLRFSLYEVDWVVAPQLSRLGG